MKRHASTALLIFTALLAALTWAGPHEFTAQGKTTPAPIDEPVTGPYQTATFALG
tara:strand:- start:2241 stop:2405 length:165 start_codon:yes stop_codon:yes gene_type:complete